MTADHHPWTGPFTGIVLPEHAASDDGGLPDPGEDAGTGGTRLRSSLLSCPFRHAFDLQWELPIP